MRPIEQEHEHRRRLSRERYARKQVERGERRKILGHWLGLTKDAMDAMKQMDNLDKELGTFGLILLLSVSVACGQGIPVLVDTNQLKTAGVKVEWKTNLYEAENLTFVTTNWMPVGPPVNIITNGVLLARRQFESATLLTNVVHRLTYQGVEHIFVASQSVGPVLATRFYDIPPPLDSPPFMAVPLRQQRQSYAPAIH